MWAGVAFGLVFVLCLLLAACGIADELDDSGPR